jgi:hypothetical protein
MDQVTYAALSVEMLLHVLQYWDGFIEVQNPNDYLTLFGRKGDQILQFLIVFHIARTWRTHTES